MLVDRVADHAAHLGVAHLDLVDGLALLAVAKEVDQQAVPVGVQRRVQHLVGQDRRRPFDRVDLGHDRGVDEPRHVEEARVAPLRITGLELVADGVVLVHEQRVQHRQADPPVALEAGLLDALAVERQRAVGVDAHLAADVAAQRVLRGLVAAVDLRAVPPVRDLVDGAGDGHFHAVAARRVALAAADEHLGLPVAGAGRVVFGQRHFDDVGEVDLAVVDPVAIHELDPRRGQQIEEGHFLHHRPAIGTERAAQQPAADLARVGRQQLLADLGADRLHLDVAEEPRAGGALLRVVEVVPAAVGGAEVTHAGRRRLPGGLESRPGGRADSSCRGSSH